jgi:hypothetical protein
LDGRIAVFQEAAGLPNRFVSAMAKQAAESVERGRSWIESVPEL